MLVRFAYHVWEENRARSLPRFSATLLHGLERVGVLHLLVPHLDLPLFRWNIVTPSFRGDRKLTCKYYALGFTCC